MRCPREKERGKESTVNKKGGMKKRDDNATLEMMPKKGFPFYFGSIMICLSVLIRREFYEIDFFSPFDFVLLTLVLLAGIFLYRWLSWRRRKMRFQWMLIVVHISLFLFTHILVSLVRHSICSYFFSVGAIASTYIIMNVSGDAPETSSESWCEKTMLWFKQNQLSTDETASKATGTGVMEEAGPSKIAPKSPPSPGMSQSAIWRALEEGEPSTAPVAGTSQTISCATEKEVSAALEAYFQRVSRIKPRSDFLLGVEQALNLREASPEKLRKITEEINKLLPHCGGDIKTGTRAKHELLRTIKAWEDCIDMPGE